MDKQVLIQMCKNKIKEAIEKKAELIKEAKEQKEKYPFIEFIDNLQRIEISLIELKIHQLNVELHKLILKPVEKKDNE